MISGRSCAAILRSESQVPANYTAIAPPDSLQSFSGPKVLQILNPVPDGHISGVSLNEMINNPNYEVFQQRTKSNSLFKKYKMWKIFQNIKNIKYALSFE